MARLSRPVDRMKPDYDVVVIGSGYGGGIAASRLARAGRRVCVLERGRELQPGDYPDTGIAAAREVQVDLPASHVGSKTALFDFHVNDEINVLVGCGLGGTSLINANVAMRAEPRVFQDPRWPSALRTEMASGEFDRHYDRAESMLRPVRLPDDAPRLDKLETLQRGADELGVPDRCYRTPITVSFESGTNHVGVEQTACNHCGDCVSGCNVGAKNTLIMNYLPDAVNFGAEIYCETSVERIERVDDHWVVHFALHATGRDHFEAPTLHVAADTVVLAAGSLGSTEILLRSRDAGLGVSSQLGKRFTGNGDVLAFAYNCDKEVNGIGFGAHDADDRKPVGACITGIIDLRDQERLDDGMVIEEGVVPGAVADLFPTVMAATAKAVGTDTDSGWGDAIQERTREWVSAVRGAYHGATRNTQTYLVMTHDGADGHMRLADDRLRIDWPGVGERAIFERVNVNLESATRGSGGTFVPNPIWTRWLGHRLVTVHPLGGCPMADAGSSGVTDHKGRVFDGDGDQIHEGLYVADGSILPRSVGINPFLTISALAERVVEKLATDRGWQIDYTLPSAPIDHSEPAEGIGLEFTETMRGHFSMRSFDDYESGRQNGERDDSPIEFTLTVRTHDLDRMIDDDAHAAQMMGTVTAPALADLPLTISKGHFQLFVDDSQAVRIKNMVYSMDLTAVDGSAFHFDAFKRIRDDGGLDIWSDTTTLYITLKADHGANGATIGRGMMFIEPADFARQLKTFKTHNTENLAEALAAQARFGQYFAGQLFDTYGGIFAKASTFDPDAPPRRRRDLRCGAPELYRFVTDDGVQLSLSRFRGGTKGPVLLSHGLGVSSKIFTTDTIDTNLVEYLHGHGYDVWALDYRASIDLPASEGQSSGDDIADHDYPKAVELIRRETGADEIDAIVHCFGSTTFFMAMCAGLTGIRSIVASQVALHADPPPVTQLMTGLHVPTALEGLGVDSLTAYVDRRANWSDDLFDAALNLYPLEREERCRSRVCHRISFLYSLLYEHDQLNTKTHDNLHELFGVANVRALDHLAKICRARHIVGYEDPNRYMPHVDRLAVPITFISGAENACFLPSSTAKSFELLRDVNGGRLYSRHVVAGYGHIDCIFGRDAVVDVYPLMLSHLERQLL